MKENVDLVKIAELRHPMSVKAQPYVKNPVKAIKAAKALDSATIGKIRGENETKTQSK